MRRAEGGLPRVNRLTDIYNAISVKYQIPFGGEDLDKYSGLPLLIRATGQEAFETSAAGEKIYRASASWRGCVVWRMQEWPAVAGTGASARELV